MKIHEFKKDTGDPDIHYVNRLEFIELLKKRQVLKSHATVPLR